MTLSTIFQLYCGGQVFWGGETEDLESTTDKTLSHNVVWSTPHLSRTYISGDRHWLHRCGIFCFTIRFWNSSDSVIYFCLFCIFCFSIRFWNSSNSLIYFCLFCIFCFLLDFGTLQTVWYIFACFPFYLEYVKSQGFCFLQS